MGMDGWWPEDDRKEGGVASGCNVAIADLSCISAQAAQRVLAAGLTVTATITAVTFLGVCMRRKSNIVDQCPHSQHTEDDTEPLSSSAWRLQNQRNYSPRLFRIQPSGIGSSPHHPAARSLHTGIGTSQSYPCISACVPRVLVLSQKIKYLNQMAQVQRSGWPGGRHLQ